VPGNVLDYRVTLPVPNLGPVVKFVHSNGASISLALQFGSAVLSAILPVVSISRQWLAHQLAYSAWANQTLLTACAALTPEELHRDLGASHKSILGTLRHIYYSERVWLKRLRANALPPLQEIGDQRLFGDPPPEPDLPRLQDDWPAVAESLRQFAEVLPDAMLLNVLRGTDCSIPVWKLFLHVVNHSTLHRGQVTSMIRQLGRRPPNTDVFSFHLVAPVA
jgi:uncharacterized damage-inducible protein DinB